MKPILQGMAFILVVAIVAFLVVDRSGLRRPGPQTATTRSATTQTAAPGSGGQNTAAQNTPVQSAAGQASSGQTAGGQAASAGPAGTGTPGSGQAGMGQMNGGPTAPAQTQGTQAQNTSGTPTASSSAASGQTGSAGTPATAGATSIQVGNRTLSGRAEVGNAVYLRNCLSCHNRDGQAYIPQYPRLSAQIASYTAAQLALFRSGERRNTAMNQMAARLSDQEIADLAAYLAAAPVANPWASRNAALRGQGQTLYARGHPQTGVTACAGCHGPQGAGNAAAGFPRVAGQSPAYFVTRIAELAALANRTDLPATTLTMAKIARAMTPQETRQLDEYIKTLR